MMSQEGAAYQQEPEVSVESLRAQILVCKV